MRRMGLQRTGAATRHARVAFLRAVVELSHATRRPQTATGRCPGTPVIKQALSNAWLKEPGLASVKDRGCKDLAVIASQFLGGTVSVLVRDGIAREPLRFCYSRIRTRSFCTTHRHAS